MRYKVELIPSDEGFAVFCLDLPGCASQGGTEEEAILNIREAIEKYVLARENGESSAKVRFVEVPEVKAAGNGLKSAAKPAPFVITPIANGLPAEWTSHKVEDLLRILEGPEYR